MKNKLFHLFFTLLSLAAFNHSFAQMFGQEPTERVSTYDVKHISIDIKLDLPNKIVEGKVTTEISPVVDDFTSFKVDAAGMKIKSVKGWIHLHTDNSELAVDYEDLKYDYDNNEITIYTKGKIAKGFPYKYRVEYTTTDPEKGLYFIGPTTTFPSKPYQVWSQGEGEDNRYWFPCYDYPNDKATTEMHVTVDKSYQTLSNGILKDKKDNADGTVTWNWYVGKPHSSYLVMLAAGNWDLIEESWEGIPISSFVAPGKKEWGEHSYRNTADIVKFFSENIGFKYPWESFLQVEVEDFIYGGMENTGAVVLFDGSVYDDKTEYDYNAASLVAHELAHQWWGDVVTCKNWSEMWLNESFATYFQCLYYEHLYGKDEFDYNIFRNGNDAIKADSTVARKPIYIRHGLGVNTYDKGSVVLNMLLNELGDENFWKAMNIYITKKQFQNVVTKDLLDAVNEATYNPMLDYNREWSWFFKQWIYSAGQPEYKVSYTYDEKLKRLKITSQQVQRLDTSSVFKMPVPVEIITSASKETVFASPDITESYVYVNLDSKPVCVIFNKGNKVLSKVYFTKPKEDWLYQLNNSEDAIDRITAIRGLKDFINDDDAVNAITKFMKEDKFWGVRSEAALMLGNSKNRMVQDNYLKNLTDEKDSRVRRSYIKGIAELYKNNPELSDNKSILEFFIINLVNNESSYYAVAEGLSTLERISDKDKIFDIVTPYLEKNSHAEIIRRHALSVLDSSNDARAVDIFLEYGEMGSTARLRNIAIRGLDGFLDNPKVIDFLNKKVLEKTRSTQTAILSLIEKAKDPSSKPFLEELIAKSNDAGFKKSVKDVLQKLN